MTEDALMRDMLLASASVILATGGTNGDLPTNLSYPDLEEVTAELVVQDGKMILSSIMGENRFGTGPQRDSFVAMSHAKLLKDINTLPGFISKWNYPNNNRTLQAEWGSVENIRFLLSSVGAVIPNASALGADVYPIFVNAMEGTGNVKLDNFSSRFLYRPPIYSDPLFQNVTLGFVMAEAPVLLNDLWVNQLRATLNT